MNYIIPLFLVFLTTIGYSQSNDSIKKYSLKFQTTSIYQWHPEFKAKYTAPTSLQNTEERALSLTSTLFFDMPIWKGAKITFNPELSGGEGVSGARGLGGFVNGETFRIGETKPVVYLARLLLEQNFDFKNNKSLKLVAGKFGLADYFDTNLYAHDPRIQFLNWSIMDHGSWDYAANTRGYTDGIYANYQYNSWQYRGAITALPTRANGPQVEFNFHKSIGISVEIEKHIDFKNKDFANVKLLGFRNLAYMGNYDLANLQTNPDITSVANQARTKYGIGLNFDFTHSDTWGVFGRINYNDGKNETWAFTEIDQSALVGFNLKGKLWNRNNDFFGVAFVANGLSPSHIKYQQLGGIGFMLGDGNLNYSPEKILETFYSWKIPNTFITLSPDYQFVVNPGYNLDRGPVSFLALRVHGEF